MSKDEIEDEFIFNESIAIELVFFINKRYSYLQKLIPEIKFLGSNPFENLFQGI